MYAHGPRELQTSGIEADSFEALADIAIANLKGATGLGMVCGPITTGGTGHQILNLEVFNATLRGLERRGVKLFNQVPYEFGLRRLAHKWEAEESNDGYCMPILTVFYARVFESGAIAEGWFIPGYQSSFGACWEREKMAAQGLGIHDLTRVDIGEFLQAEHPAEHVEEVMDLLLAAEVDRLIEPWGCKVTGIGPDAVAVMGDARAYAPSVIIRVPPGTDQSEIGRISNEITNKVRGVARVMMDIESM